MLSAFSNLLFLATGHNVIFLKHIFYVLYLKPGGEYQLYNVYTKKEQRSVDEGCPFPIPDD